MIEQLRALWKRRDLIVHLVRSDLKVTYKNKALGYLWSLLDPFMMMLVYVVLVQGIFHQGGKQYPVLLFSALLAWRWFTYSVQQATASISSKEKLIHTVAFPLIILPTQDVLSGLIRYALSLAALVPMMVAYRVTWSLNLLWLPAVVAVQLVLTFGAALVCSVLGVYLRDLQNILTFALRALFYLSPALWSIADRIPPHLRKVYLALNPFASLFETYKSVLVRGGPPLHYLVVVLGVGAVLVVVGLALFSRLSNRLAKDV